MKFFLRLKGSLELNLRNFNYSKDISDISKHPQKFHRTSLPLKILNKNGTPKKGKAYRLPFIMGFQRGCFLLRNLRLCCFLPALVRSQLEPKTPSDYAKRKTCFSPKIGWADFLGNFRLGGWVGVNQSCFGVVRFRVSSKHFLTSPIFWCYEVGMILDLRPRNVEGRDDVGQTPRDVAIRDAFPMGILRGTLHTPPPTATFPPLDH